MNKLPSTADFTFHISEYIYIICKYKPTLFCIQQFFSISQLFVTFQSIESMASQTLCSEKNVCCVINLDLINSELSRENVDDEKALVHFQMLSSATANATSSHNSVPVSLITSVA